jgi:hypothetical protein
MQRQPQGRLPDQALQDETTNGRGDERERGGSAAGRASEAVSSGGGDDGSGGDGSRLGWRRTRGQPWKGPRAPSTTAWCRSRRTPGGSSGLPTSSAASIPAPAGSITAQLHARTPLAIGVQPVALLGGLRLGCRRVCTSESEPAKLAMAPEAALLRRHRIVREGHPSDHERRPGDRVELGPPHLLRSRRGGDPRAGVKRLAAHLGD